MNVSRCGVFLTGINKKDMSFVVLDPIIEFWSSLQCLIGTDNSVRGYYFEFAVRVAVDCRIIFALMYSFHCKL